jgi:hypothetical protein
MGALGVLYWHMHLSHLALRANLYLLVGTLGTALLLRAYRRTTILLWASAGIAMGVMTYTYFASIAWMGYLGLLLLGVLLDTRRRWGAALALLCAALVAAPMMAYASANPGQVLERSSTVSAIGLGALTNNAEAWGRALFEQGDTNVLFNLPGRPILDPLSGLLAVFGLVGIVLNRRWRIPGLLLLGLSFATLAPSLLSNYAPHFLRGSGFTVPMAVLLGIGAAAVASLLGRLGWRAESRLIPVLLLLAVGIVTARDYHLRWLTDPETFTAMEMHINEAANLLGEETSDDTAIYFSPFTPAHPVIILRGQDLAPRPVAAFNSHECWVVADRPSAYVSLTLYEPSFAEQLAQWTDVELLYQDVTDYAPRPRYSVFATSPTDLPGAGKAAQFSDQFAVRLLRSLPDRVTPGSTLSVILGVRALRSPTIAPSLFLHLYTIPTPYEGGAMIGQADSQLCTSYPAHLWRSDETIIQTFQLTVPTEADPGEYLIGMGIYPFPEGPRLPVVLPDDSVYDYVALKRVEVVK